MMSPGVLIYHQDLCRDEMELINTWDSSGQTESQVNADHWSIKGDWPPVISARWPMPWFRTDRITSRKTQPQMELTRWREHLEGMIMAQSKMAEGESNR